MDLDLEGHTFLLCFSCKQGTKGKGTRSQLGADCRMESCSSGPPAQPGGWPPTLQPPSQQHTRPEDPLLSPSGVTRKCFLLGGEGAPLPESLPTHGMPWVFTALSPQALSTVFHETRSHTLAAVRTSA